MRNREYIYRELLDTDGNVVGREYGGKLIRCKDCKNNPSTLIGWIECPMTGAGTRQPNDFCSYAEPKDTTEEVRKQLKDMEQRREMDRKK